VYVDDLIIIGSSSSSIKTFKNQMAVTFKMSDLGLLSYYLGIEVKQGSEGIALSQSNYARKLQEKGGMQDCNPCQIPMEPRLKLSKVSCERREKEELVLDGYSDSDLKKSTSGVIFFLCDSVISWQSTKQRVVALSSCEAEYIAASAAACQSVWLARVLGEILEAVVARPVIRIDNKSAISLVRNPVHHDRSKHIDVRFHFLQECAQVGLIEVDFIRTEDQLADMLTKSLCRTKFEGLCAKIGLRKNKEQHKI
jgi:hypothetical protein